MRNGAEEQLEDEDKGPNEEPDDEEDDAEEAVKGSAEKTEDRGECEAEEGDELNEEDGYERVKAGIPGRCWRLLVKEGDKVKAGAVLVSVSVHFVLLSASFIS